MYIHEPEVSRWHFFLWALKVLRRVKQIIIMAPHSLASDYPTIGGQGLTWAMEK